MSELLKNSTATALGIELQFELLLAFVGVYELWEIPAISKRMATLRNPKQKRFTSSFRLSRLDVNSTATWFEHILSIVTDHNRHIESRRRRLHSDKSVHVDAR
jgi:hypothetical protein